MSKSSILVLGKRGGILQWYEGLLDAKASLGEIHIDGFAFNHNNWHERFVKKILKLGRQNPDHYTARLLAKKIQNAQPDIILIADLFYLSLPLLKVLQQAKPKAKIYHWIGDFFDERLIQSKEVVDHFLFTDSSFIDDAKKLGIEQAHYLPLAFNPCVFYAPKINLLRKEALLFIGAWSENRQALLQQLQIPVTVYGKGWDKLKSDYITVHPHSLSLQHVAGLYQQYQYVLNIINHNNTRIGLNMRCFEAMGAGATLVTEFSNDLPRCFNIEKDLIYFSDAAELTAKMNAKPCIDVQGTCSKAHLEHTYAQRIKAILCPADQSL